MNGRGSGLRFTVAFALFASPGCSNAAQKATAARPPGEAPGVKEAVALCEHGVPANLCTRCNPDLIPAFKAAGDWCDEHGVPKSQCRECDPNLTFNAPTAAETGAKNWCEEHAVPESMCTKCHPELVAKFVEAGDYCREHGYPESVCPYCHPELVLAAGHKPPQFPPPGTVVRLASAETAAEAGIRTVRVASQRFAQTLEVVGQLEFNRNRLAQLSARGESLVVDVRVDVGDEVKAGQSLVVLASGAVGADQAQLSAATARLEAAQSALDREQGLAKTGVSAKKNVDEARREVAAAEADADAARAALNAAGATAGGAGKYALSAPFNGVVVSRNAMIGRTAGAGDVLIEVADLSTMWASLDIPEDDARQVRVGQRASLAVEGQDAAPIDVTIARVGASVDPHTRTVRARVEIANPDRTLRAGLFIGARIQVAPEHDALLVPRESVQRVQGHDFVFVKRSDGAFDPLAVDVVGASATHVEIQKGLVAEAEVVTTGAFLLKTEILKESIGAGCCDAEGEK